MSEATKKFLTDVAFPAVKADARNKNKGLIPRFHQDLSDQFYGGTKTSLGKACGELATEGFLHKAFIKFPPGKTDVIGTPDENGVKVITEGRNKGMKLSKDGRLSTPIYWIKGDPDIPDWAKFDRTENYRMGEEFFKAHQEEPTE